MAHFTTTDGISLHYRFDGAENKPLLVLSNSLGTDLSMWDQQVAALVPHYRLLRYDKRGHGASSAPTADHSLARLGRDVLELLDHTGAAKALFCGLSIGGQTGMWLGINAPQRFTKIVLCNTAAKIGTPEMWNARIDTVLKNGPSAITEGVMARWFTPAFGAAQPENLARFIAMFRRNSAAGYAAACEAVRDADLRADLAKIPVPVLVIAGTEDLATPASDGKAAAEAIPGASYVELKAAHISNAEQPEAFDRALLGFLKG